MDLNADLSSIGEYKNFRQITRQRLLHEMLRWAKTAGDSKLTSWKVLIVDKFTLKIMSHTTNMDDIMDEGVSLIEDMCKLRQPFPSRDAIYFIQPTKENVAVFLSDMSGRSPLYNKAFVFFSSPISQELFARIKGDLSVASRIGALREMNLEYLPIEFHGFVTGNDNALEKLFAVDQEVDSGRDDECLNVTATRIATVFASLREFPVVRYRAAKFLDDITTLTTFRDLIPTKLAARIWDLITNFQDF